MTFSKQLFSLPFLFLFFFPFQHASYLKKCSSSFNEPLRCGPLEVPIRFPFCDHPNFNLHCDDLNQTILELPMSGTFLVLSINYRYRMISITDPESCLVKRLLNFNLSGSPFISPYMSSEYTFMSCPKEAVLPFSYRAIPCLSNTTSFFFATSKHDLAESLLPLCQIVKRLHVPGFSSYANDESLLMLEWDSPNCTRCEIDNLTCGLKRKYSEKVKCFGGKKNGHLSSGVLALIISFSIIIFFIVSICACLRIFWGPTRNPDSQREQNEVIVAAIVTQQPRGTGTMVTTGLGQSTIDSYKKVELGDSKRLSGTNGIVCPICLSEYKSKETVRFIPVCEHCFHVECIDLWLKIHGSCPLCRNSHA